MGPKQDVPLERRGTQLEDPWFVEAPELDAAPTDPAFEAWVSEMEAPNGAWVKPRSTIAAQLTALYFL
jgi:hypothetical protein